MAQHPIYLHFLGAAGTVTGSKFLLEAGKYKILIDCGLFQGLKKLRQLNWEYLPVNAAEINAVLLTHGHLDHCGFLPKLVKMGYKKAIYGTKPTLDVAEIILKDSAKIQEEEAGRANREGYSKHSPAKPLYNVQDAEHAIEHFKDMPVGEWLELLPDVKVRFRYCGHILGAASVEVDAYGQIIVFSGDIGRESDVLMYPPEKPEKADVVVMESTYGDRLHPKEGVEERLKNIVLNTAQRGGTLIIPSFAVERAQVLMYLLWQLRETKTIPNLPMIMDSPMGKSVLQLYEDHSTWHKLEPQVYRQMCDAFIVVQDYKETKQLIASPFPKIVIAGSGMLTGGRVLSYLQHYLEKPETTILLPGFQAEGTRGRALLRGAPELKIFGKYYKVKAQVESIQVLSAHADQTELINWLTNIKEPPHQIFLVHGEPHSTDALRLKITDTYGWNCTVPDLFSIHKI